MNKVITHIQQWSDDMFEIIFADNSIAEINNQYFNKLMEELIKFPKFKAQNYLNSLQIPVQITMGSNTILDIKICEDQDFEFKGEIMTILVMVLEF